VKGSSTKRKDKKKSVGKTAKQIGEITPKNEFNQNDKELKLPVRRISWGDPFLPCEAVTLLF